ncbi:MAG: NAD-dependent epimerase/dehydratase family protein, partial [Bacteroidota bacterium]
PEDEKMRRWESEKAILDLLDKYGIRVNSSESVKSISSKSVKSVSVEIWGTGTPMREFLWSEEMADACVYLMENTNFDDIIRVNQWQNQCPSVDKKEIRNQHINIGTGKEISVRDLAYLIKEKIGFGGELVFNTAKPDGTMRKLTDPSKIHALGWHHKIEIGDGIEKLYSWYLKK